MKKKRDFYSTLRYFSEEERIIEINKTKMIEKLGIIIFYDNTYSNSGNYKPSMYKTIEEYERDRARAHYLITMNKPIPQALQNKLIAARIELEKKGLLEPFIE